MNLDLCCARFPGRRRYTSMANAMTAADRTGQDVEVRRCEERHGGCGGWHLPEGVVPHGGHTYTSCPTPNKDTFLTEWEAEDGLEAAKAKYEHAADQRVYTCPYAPWRAGGFDFHFHLTSISAEMSY